MLECYLFFLSKYQLQYIQLYINLTQLTMNFGPKLDYNLKRSFVSDSYQNQTQPQQIIRGGLTKRPSYTLASDYSPSPLNTQLPKTPKAGSSHNTGSIMDQYQLASQFYHQSNYVHQMGTQYPTQHVQSFGHHVQYAPQTQNQTQVGMQFNAGGYTIRPQSSINKVQLSTSRAEKAIQRVESFSLDQKKPTEIGLQQRIRELETKLQKTIKRLSIQQNTIQSIQKHNESVPNMQQIKNEINQYLSQMLAKKQMQQNMQISIINNEIQQVRRQVSENRYFVDGMREDFNSKLERFCQNMNKSIESVSQSANYLVSSSIQQQNRKKSIEMERLRIQINRQIELVERALEDKIKKGRQGRDKDKDQYQKLTNCSSYEVLPSHKTFLGDPILLKYATKVSIRTKQATNKYGGYNKQRQMEVEDQQTIYKVDNEGYLLDSQGHYIINGKYEQIKLNNEQLDVIRNLGLIQ